MLHQPISKTALAFLAGATAIGLVSLVALTAIAKDSFNGSAAEDYKVESVTNTYYRAGTNAEGKTMIEGGWNVTKVDYSDPSKTDIIRGYNSCIVHGQTSYAIVYPPKTAVFALVSGLPQVKTSGPARATIASLGKSVPVTLEMEAKQTSLTPKKYEVGCRFYDAATKAELAHSSSDGKFSSPYALLPVTDGTFTFRVSSAAVAPTVSITKPTEGQKFTLPMPIALTARAADADGAVRKVEFFLDGIKVGEDTSSPYAIQIPSPSQGAHALTAKATDNSNLSTTSAAVNITVVDDSYLGPPGQVGI